MKYILVLLGTLAIVIAPYVTAIKIPWSAVDDWYSLKIFKEVDREIRDQGLIQGLRHLYEQDTSRIRHAYWTSEYLLFKTFGFSPINQHLIRLFILASTTLLVIRLSYILFRDQKAAITSGLIFGLFGATAENWIRLGPAEIFQVLYLLLSFILAFTLTKQSRTFIPGTIFLIILLVAGILSKETSVSWLIFPLFLFIFNIHRSMALKIYLITGFLLITLIGLLIIRIKYLASGPTYTSNFSFDLKAIDHFFIYQKILFRGFGALYPTLAILFPLFVIKRNWERKEAKLIVALTIWFFAQLLIQSFWGVPIGRYLLPLIVPLALLLGYTFSTGLYILKPLTLKISFILLLILVLSQNILDTIVVKSSLANRDLGNWRSLEMLSQIAPPNVSVHANISQKPEQLEWWYGLSYLLQNDLERADITLVPISETIPSNRLIYHWSGSEAIPKSMLINNNPNLSLLYSYKSHGFNNGKSIIGSLFEVILKFKAPKYVFGAPYNLNWYIYKT